MVVFPNCKINLGLNIVSKRPDGYHDIETVFYPVYGLTDILEVTFDTTIWTPKGSVPVCELAQTGLHVDCPPEKNIIVKALYALANHFSLPHVRVHLHKQIPMGAGLGGGSADAAFFVKCLRDMLQLEADDTQLKSILSTVGADCPFFIDNQPSIATGIGNILSNCSIPSIDGKWILLVKPNVHVSTAQAYAGVIPSKPNESVASIVQLPLDNWQGCMHNDFEPSVFSSHPEIAEVKEWMMAHGAIYSAMSGSGATVFGIFNSPINQIFNDNYFQWQGQL